MMGMASPAAEGGAMHHVAILLALFMLCGCGGSADRRAGEALLAGAGQADIIVLPAVLRSGDGLRHDAREAERLAAGLSGQGTARAVAGEAQVPLTPGWKSSSKAMLRRSARQFRRWARLHPAGTGWTLLPEYLLGSRMVAGICVYVVDRQGRLALVRRYDSRDLLYQEMAPIGPGDCTNLLLSALRETLNPPPVD
jgi:hypothetical protein